MTHSQQAIATIQQLLVKYHTPVGAPVNAHVESVLERIKRCRTAALGYHVYKCSNESCGYVKYQYHSCRDRHCPHCGAIKKQEWIDARMQELLPVRYYHVVFTLPHELNSVVLGYRRILFKLLFDASAQTLLTFAKDVKYLNAVPGIISVLHTWGQQLSFHPHVHCIVSGGGVRKDNTWKESSKSRYGFLFPVRAMQAVFRGKFLQEFKDLLQSGKVVLQQGANAQQLLETLYSKQWVVYSKLPFGGPQEVIEYLGRYTHKVAISNNRICSINDQEQTVTFEYKDYSDSSRKKQMTLSCKEFIRRFQMHILPQRFTKIRTYGYLANRNRKQRIRGIVKHMKLPQHKGSVKLPLAIAMLSYYGIDIRECPCCHFKTLELQRVCYPKFRSDDG